MAFARHFATAFAVMLAASAQLAAQNATVIASSNEQSASVTATVAVERPAVSDAIATPVSFAPTETNARVGVRPITSPAPLPVEPEEGHMRHSVALMIVGGTILVVGAVVGGQPGTIIMIGGGTVGVIGLIRYLQHP